MMTITGTIKEFQEIQTGTSKSGSEWKKQNFVITNNEGYNNKEQVFAFEVFGAEKVDNLNKYNKVGQTVEVSFNISCNEWKNKYYTSLQAWKIMASKEVINEPEPLAVFEEETDDVPF